MSTLAPRRSARLSGVRQRYTGEEIKDGLNARPGPDLVPVVGFEAGNAAKVDEAPPDAHDGEPAGFIESDDDDDDDQEDDIKSESSEESNFEDDAERGYFKGDNGIQEYVEMDNGGGDSDEDDEGGEGRLPAEKVITRASEERRTRATKGGAVKTVKKGSTKAEAGELANFRLPIVVKDALGNEQLRVAIN